MTKQRVFASCALGLALAVYAGILSTDLSAASRTGFVEKERQVAQSRTPVAIEVLQPYLAIQRALAADSLEGVPEQARQLAGADVPGAQRLARAEGIKEARHHFETVSNYLIEQVRSNGVEAKAVHLAHCPMAFGNKGASWLQEEARLANPYYGSMMLRCGRIEETMGASSKRPTPAVVGRSKTDRQP